MRSRGEQMPTLDPERFVYDVLAEHPELPVGRVDIETRFSNAITIELGHSEPGYAWERVPRFAAEIKETFYRIKTGALLCLDLGSSIPSYSAMLRAIEFGRAGDRARDIEGPIFSGEALESLRRDGRADLVPLAGSLSKDKEARKLLTAAIQEVLYGMTTDEADPKSDALRRRIASKLVAQRQTYHEEVGSSDIEAAWGLRFSATQSERTYLETLSQLGTPTKTAKDVRQRLSQRPDNQYPDSYQRLFDLEDMDKLDYELANQKIAAGSNLARRYILWQTHYLVEKIAGNPRYRPARFFSLDQAVPWKIAQSSTEHTPKSTQSMNLYSHAYNSLFNPHQHIHRDMFEPLPFPDNSLALITIFDGWPFNFQLPENVAYDKDKFIVFAVSTLEAYYHKLTYGGEIVIFPASIAGGGPETDEAIRSAGIKLGERVNINTITKTFPTKVLEMFMMSEGDRETARSTASTLIGRNDALDVLVIRKPNKGEFRSRELAKLALNEARSQG